LSSKPEALQAVSSFSLKVSVEGPPGQGSWVQAKKERRIASRSRSGSYLAERSRWKLKPTQPPGQ
jgi:hypothetical protein